MSEHNSSLQSANIIYSHDPFVPEELRIRDGLPNVFQKLTAGEEVNIAYIGGSITEAEGWRNKTFVWFQEQFSQATIRQIDATVSGTGADFAACRLDHDLLQHQPDLVFVEFRVNMGGGYEARAIEGVIRQIWENNPRTDICLVYTVGDWMIEQLTAGEQQCFGIIMEEMANYYGIPSIDLGVEVIRRLNAGTLEFTSTTKPVNKLWFATDGCHPTDEGHELYTEIVSRSLLQIQEQETCGIRELPIAREPLNFLQAQLQPIATAVLSAGWKTVDSDNDEIYCNDFDRTRAMLNDAVKCTCVGESLTIEWEGRLIGFSYIPQKEGIIEIEVSIDGQAPETFELDQISDDVIYARFIYAKEQTPGKHTATLTVTKLPEGMSYYAGQCLLPSL